MASSSVTDFMPVAEDGRPSGEHPEIHRHLRCSRGRVTMQMIFMPRFEYGARATRLESLRAGLFATDRTDQVLTLSQRQAVRVGGRAVDRHRPVRAGEGRGALAGPALRR